MTSEEKLPVLALNPDNPRQAFARYCLMSADDAGEHRHPELVMRELAERLGFRIVEAIPQSIADCWWFWIEFDGEPPSLPATIFTGRQWLPVGTV